MKLVIGIVGAPLAGKETCANMLEKLLVEDGYSVSRHTFSEILRETLDLWGIPRGRDNEQKMAIIMNAETGFGDGALSRAMKHRIMNEDVDVTILDGVRWLGDEKMLRGLNDEGVKSILVYISGRSESALRTPARAEPRRRKRHNMGKFLDRNRRGPKWTSPISAAAPKSCSRITTTTLNTFTATSTGCTRSLFDEKGYALNYLIRGNSVSGFFVFTTSPSCVIAARIFFAVSGRNGTSSIATASSSDTRLNNATARVASSFISHTFRSFT